MRIQYVIGWCAMLVWPGAVQGQAPGPLDEGTTSFAFSILDSGSSSAGVWYFFSDRTSLGLMVQAGISRRESSNTGTSSTYSLGLGPAVKRYFSPTEHVAPFFFSAASANWARTEDGSGRHRTRWGMSADLAVGADWFPLDRISIGGHVGVHAAYFQEDGPVSFEGSSWSIGTMTSALSLHLYF